MNYIIIKDEIDILKIANQKVIFIDTKFNQMLFEPLLDRYLNDEIEAYVKINNEYAHNTIDDERLRISNGDTFGLEHYIQVDFMNNQYNKYLGLRKFETDKTINVLNEFRKQQARYYDLLLDDEKKLVIEKYCEINEQLSNDINMLHYTIDARGIALTSNPNAYFTYCEQMTSSEKLISRSNKSASNKFFLLPQNIQYQPVNKVVYVDGIDYKEAFKLIRDDDYIIILNDELFANRFIVNQCSEYNIKSQLDFNLPQSKYIGQNRNILLYIKLIEEYGELDIYEISENKLHFKEKLEKNTYNYQKMILNYKNDIFYNNINE